MVGLRDPLGDLESGLEPQGLLTEKAAAPEPPLRLQEWEEEEAGVDMGVGKRGDKEEEDWEAAEGEEVQDRRRSSGCSGGGGSADDAAAAASGAQAATEAEARSELP